MRIQKKITYNTKIRYEKKRIYFGSPDCFFVWEHEKYGNMYQKFMEIKLIGYRLGDILIYIYNVSFIVNLGKGTASQVKKIVLYIEKII